MVQKKSSVDSEDVLNPRTATEKITKNKAKDEQDELSEEDQQLVSELEMIVERLKESSVDIHRSAMENLNNVIRSTTSSMTSVPKPLKYLKGHYATLIELHGTWSDERNKKSLASILSLLGMAYDKEGKRDCLRYRLLAGFGDGQISEWGHEYVRHLAMEIGEEFAAKVEEEDEESTETLLTIAKEVVPFFLKHNADADAVDLLEELGHHELIADFVTKETFERVCLYMISCSPLLAPPSDLGFLETARKIYGKFGKPAQCLPLSIRLGRPELIEEDWESCDTRVEKAQLAFIMARQQVYMPHLTEGDDELLACMNNTGLSKSYRDLARELELLDPKAPEDIYKLHLENTSDVALDSARHNLASTFVNAFVNAGYGTDKLMTGAVDGNEWIYKNKDMGMLSAAASLGMVNLWDVELGLNDIDKYLYTEDNTIKAGALLAIGMITAGVHDETDSAKALLSDYTTDESCHAIVKLAAISGLGLAYAGTNRQDILDMLVPLISDTEITIDLSSMAALSAGLVCIGSGNSDVSTVILQSMMERVDTELSHKLAR
ncbi:proteasome regulatory particle base subunit, partial [Coemansia furcata]